MNKHDALAPLLFLVLFVLFVYGSLTVALLGLSAWVASACDLTFFLNLGFFGIFLLASCFLVIWLGSVFFLALIPHFILRWLGRGILADRVCTIIVFLLVHIFTVPFILWRVYRNNNPYLRRKYRQKLKRMVGGRKMQERRLERQRRLIVEKKSF